MIKTILNVFRSRRVDFYFFLCCPRGNDTMMNLSSVVFFSFLFRLFVVCDIHKLFFFKIKFGIIPFRIHMYHTLFCFCQNIENNSAVFCVCVERDVNFGFDADYVSVGARQDVLHSFVGCVSTSIVLYAYIYRY